VQRRERLEALQKVTTLTRALDESPDEQVAALQRDLERERARNASHAEAIKEKQAELEAREGKIAEREAAFERTKVATTARAREMGARFAAERASLDAYKNRLDDQRTALLQAVGAVGRATLSARLAEVVAGGAAEGAEPVD
jgi:thioesterase domain-containing protein